MPLKKNKRKAASVPQGKSGIKNRTLPEKDNDSVQDQDFWASLGMDIQPGAISSTLSLKDSSSDNKVANLTKDEVTDNSDTDEEDTDDTDTEDEESARALAEARAELEKTPQGRALVVLLEAILKKIRKCHKDNSKRLKKMAKMDKEREAQSHRMLQLLEKLLELEEQKKAKDFNVSQSKKIRKEIMDLVGSSPLR